jgi:pimeloyl-ACP methyl ester carboxylesterase
MRRGYIVAPEKRQLHYRTAGDRGGQSLVLIHQSPSSGAMWEPILPELASRGYFVVAPDLIGHGASDGPDVPPTLNQYADGIWWVLDGVGIDSASLLGHHSGASIAVVMAAQQPRRVKALALWGVPLMTPEREKRLGGEGQPDWEHAEAWICKRWEGRRAASGDRWTAEIGRRALLELLQAGPNSHWLHNATSDSSAVLDLTESSRRLIALDIPCYGESDPLDVSEPSLDDYATALAEAFEALGLEAADLEGWGSGANLAAAFAHRYPERATALQAHEPVRPSARVYQWPSLAPEWDGTHLVRAWMIRRDRLR